MQCSYLPRDVVGAVIDSDAWVEALRPHRDEQHKNKLTPFRMMIQKMPGMLVLVHLAMDEVLMYRELFVTCNMEGESHWRGRRLPNPTLK